MKIALVYYSGTGNTEAMADIVKAELGKKAEVSVIDPSAFGPGDVSSYDAIAFGCPAMGAEVLEEDVFEPMFASVEENHPVRLIWMGRWRMDAQLAGKMRERRRSADT